MTHYQTLELPTTATAADIRRAYRRLVFLTHPDRTPDPAAHARYLAITAAYEVLSDPARRQAYDAAPLPPQGASAHPTSPGRARAATRGAAAAPQAAPVPLSVRYAAEYARVLRLARPLLVGAGLLALSLALDLGLAGEHLETVLQTETAFHSGRRGSYLTTRHQTNRGVFTRPGALPVGTAVRVRRTPLWRTAISIRVAPTAAPSALASVYDGPRNGFWLGLLVAATLALVPRFNSDLRLTACLATVVFLGLTLVLLFA